MAVIVATRNHCRTGYNCHWVALQAGCAQQSSSVDPRVALQGVNYTTAPGARPAHLSPRGGRNPGASSLPLVGRGTSQKLAGHQQSKQLSPGGGKRVEWTGRRLFWPHWSCLLQPYHNTMTYYTIPCLLLPYHTIPYLPWLVP